MYLKEAINNIKDVCKSFDDCEYCPCHKDDVCYFDDLVPIQYDTDCINNAVIADSVSMLKNYCDSRPCYLCEFYEDYFDDGLPFCMLLVFSPDWWDIDERV